MRFKVWLVLIALGAQGAGAQTLGLQLIGSAGGSAAPDSNDLEWSLGEAVIGPFNDSATTTFGFQEYNAPVPVGLAPPDFGGARMVMQRSSGILKIFFNGNLSGYSVRLFNSRGRQLRNYSVLPGQTELSIPTHSLAETAVILRVSTPDRQTIQNFKFIGGEDP